MKKIAKELKRSARQALQQKSKILAHRVSSLAFMIFQLHDICGLDDQEVQEIDAMFRVMASSLGELDLVEHQIKYASRLAEYEGDLLYEEMHKLFSICDEIHALVSLGFGSEEEQMEQLAKSLRSRFNRQPGIASLVADDRREDWNRGLWWYQSCSK